MKKDALLFWKLNCFYSPEEDKKGFSIFLNKNLFKNKLKLSGQFSLGIFPYEENSISSWFTDQLYYHEGNHLCANYQLSIECGKFQTSFLQGLYENPFSSISSIYRSDSKFSTDRFTFTLSALYNPNTRENTIITSSDKVIKNCMQFRSSLQYKYRCGKSFPIFIKNALASYLNLNLEESQQDLKFSAASQFICPFTSTSLLVNVNANLNTENPYSPSYDFDSATIKLQSSAYIKDFSPGITASITLNPSQSFDSLSISSKFGLNISYSKFPKISGNASISLNHKDGELSSRKLSASLKASFSFKFINVILKFSADTNI
ncbi:MAG: hypothetical protein K6C97_05605 [Treponema sp.]|nr:hypothetical protein [Treponema sp.]